VGLAKKENLNSLKTNRILDELGTLVISSSGSFTICRVKTFQNF